MGIEEVKLREDGISVEFVLADPVPEWSDSSRWRMAVLLLDEEIYSACFTSSRHLPISVRSSCIRNPSETIILRQHLVGLKDVGWQQCNMEDDI